MDRQQERPDDQPLPGDPRHHNHEYDGATNDNVASQYLNDHRSGNDHYDKAPHYHNPTDFFVYIDYSGPNYVNPASVRPGRSDDPLRGDLDGRRGVRYFGEWFGLGAVGGCIPRTGNYGPGRINVVRHPEETMKDNPFDAAVEVIDLKIKDYTGYLDSANKRYQEANTILIKARERLNETEQTLASLKLAKESLDRGQRRVR